MRSFIVSQPLFRHAQLHFIVSQPLFRHAQLRSFTTIVSSCAASLEIQRVVQSLPEETDAKIDSLDNR